MKIDFDEIWQKYSKYSRTEFACFSFHVGLKDEKLIKKQTHMKTETSKFYSSLLNI